MSLGVTVGAIMRVLGGGGGGGMRRGEEIMLFHKIIATISPKWETCLSFQRRKLNKASFKVLRGLAEQ